MGEAKIEIKVGEVAFSGEGTEKWLSEQLDKLIEKIPQLSKVHSQKQAETGGTAAAAGAGPAARQTIAGTLAAFLKEKAATSNQVRKFLATAIWLHDHENIEFVNTSDVITALSAAKQKELTNAAASLNNNVSKGFCSKKTKNQFFVTDEGRADIG
jgi:hypothetical protein